jgi:hypothetical protein
LGDGRIAEKALRQMGVNDVAIEEALTHPRGGRYDVYDKCLQQLSRPRVSPTGGFLSHMSI